MENSTRLKIKKIRARYTDVNVWAKTFGPIAVAAVFDVYSQKMGVPYSNAKKLNFTHCVEKLRVLEDDSYIPWKNR
jgi:hypothetical protein